MAIGRIYPSMCSIAWRERPIEEIVPLVAAAGYAGLEIWGPHLDRFVEQHGALEPLVAQLEQSDLRVPMVSPYFDLPGDPAKSRATAQRHIKYALALDCRLIRTFTRGGDSDEASEETWRTVIEGLKRICDLGLAHGIGLALETHDNNVHDTTSNTLRLIREVNSPNLYVNLDIYNLYARGEDPIESLGQLGPWMRILHLKNQDDSREATTLLQGRMDYRPFLRALVDGGYEGYASIEWFGSDPAGAAVRSMAELRDILGDQLESRA